MRPRVVLRTTLALCLLTLAHCQDWCQPVPAPADFDKGLSQLYACSSVPPFLLAYMWFPVQITIHCPSTRYSVYKGDSLELLRKNIGERTTAFCGWESLLDGRECRFQMSPFWHTYVGIKEAVPGCKLEADVKFSLPMMASALGGIALFYLSPSLTSSMFFRLGCGSAMFTLGSLIILVFVLMRNVPHKRTATVGLALMGSSGLATLRWLTGQWLPSWTQLSQNPFFQAYVLASIVVGAALTYWFDDRRSAKLNTLIRMGLRAAGLALVYVGTWVMPVAFAGVSGVLLTSLISPQMQASVQANVRQAGARVQRVAHATAAVVMSPFTKTPRTDELAGASPAPGSLSGFSFWGSASAARRKQLALQLQEAEEQRRRRQALGLPVSDELELSDLVPMHLKTPPPDPWSLTFKARPQGHARGAIPFEEKVSQVLQRRHHSPGATTRRRGANPSAAASSGADGSGAAAASGSGGQHGRGAPAAQAYIYNPLTGRNIKLGGDTYLRLVEAGWTPDLKEGIMLAPPQEEGHTAGGGGGDSGGAGARGGARGPAKSTRSRS